MQARLQPLLQEGAPEDHQEEGEAEKEVGQTEDEVEGEVGQAEEGAQKEAGRQGRKRTGIGF